MALPTLSKTWVFNVNNDLNDRGTATLCNQQLMFRIKELLLSFGWTVRGSSDSVTAGMDAVDRWVTSANLVWGQTLAVKSWICLQRADVPFELVISLDSGGLAATTPARVVVALTSFAGGTTVNRPTSVDEKDLLDVGGVPQAWHNIGNIAYDCALHAWCSSDLAVQRFVVLRNSVVVLYISLDVPQDPVTNWTTPFTACWLANDILYTTVNDLAKVWGYKNPTWFACYLSTEGYIADMVGQRVVVANEFSNEYAMTPAGLVSDTANRRGRHGQAFDQWFVSSSIVNGTMFPDDASRQFIVFGNLAFPWNGGLVLLA